MKTICVFTKKNLPLHCSIHHANWISWIVTHDFLNFFTLSELTTINNSLLAFRATWSMFSLHSIALVKHSRLRSFKALANRRCSFEMERNEKPIGEIFILLDFWLPIQLDNWKIQLDLRLSNWIIENSIGELIIQWIFQLSKSRWIGAK